MPITSVLFSFEGRIDRRTFWLKGVLPLVVLSLVPLLGVILLWSGFAVYAKRWHDLDKSGWWNLIFIVLGVVLALLAFREGSPVVWVPVVILSWATLIVPGVLEGTDGPNRYGPKPGEVSEDRLSDQPATSANLNTGEMTMQRGRIVFTGSFLGYSIKGFLIAVLMIILAIPTLTISLWYIPYWNIKYFFAHMEIELPQPPAPQMPQAATLEKSVAAMDERVSRLEEAGTKAEGETSPRRTGSGEDLELPPAGRV